MARQIRKPDSPTIRHCGPDSLPQISVYDVGENFAVETVEIANDSAHALLDAATAGCPAFVLKAADSLSRRWLVRANNRHLGEIDRIAARIGRPGAHYFNTSYEWGCTTGAGPCPISGSPRLIRVLDWPTPGLGRNVIAADIRGKAGRWVSLTWPGYTGVLQTMAPGRFAAAINQPPMDRFMGFMPADWAINRSMVWRNANPTPAHLLRRVFENAVSYDEARHLLASTPISAPAIYTLSGISCDEACVIERKQEEAHIIAGPASAANEWQEPNWGGRARGNSNPERRKAMSAHLGECQEGFDWLEPPIRSEFTRLALIAEAGTGRLLAQGFEKDGPATRILRLN